MQARMSNPALNVPGALEAMLALAKSASRSSLPKTTTDLVHLRASQINGCSVCVEMHSADLKKSGVPLNKIFAVGAWRDSPYFDDEERAALALTEAVTRIADRPDPVPDEIYDEAAKQFDEKALASLIVHIALINVFNRVNVATRQPAGEWTTSASEAQAS